MKTAIKKALPASFGASLGAALAQASRCRGVWGIADFLSYLLFSFAITITVVTAFNWIWDLVRRNKSQKAQ